MPEQSVHVHVVSTTEIPNMEKLPEALKTIYGKGNFTMGTRGTLITVMTSSKEPENLVEKLRDMGAVAQALKIYPH
ncbi:hypothetical protein F66182_1369 [Fusarium sp. NRRL 66182]|nr:hypothetical protein F66182_1369 [Fusarium sp. NRRL 66182]